MWVNAAWNRIRMGANEAETEPRMREKGNTLNYRINEGCWDSAEKAYRVSVEKLVKDCGYYSMGEFKADEMYVICGLDKGEGKIVFDFATARKYVLFDINGQKKIPKHILKQLKLENKQWQI